MYIQTEGIVLKQVKTMNGRRMITIFSKIYGKISCGSSITEGGKNKTALALRPFTYGKYELFKGRETYNIQGAETLKSYYGIGEDVDKYMAASYVLELTEKVLMDEEAQPKLFMYLLDFFEMLEKRKKSFNTLVIGYQVKMLDLQGLTASEGLKSKANADIIGILKYIEENKLRDLENLALNSDVENEIKLLLKDYFAFHLGVENLKSESLLV